MSKHSAEYSFVLYITRTAGHKTAKDRVHVKIYFQKMPKKHKLMKNCSKINVSLDF